MKLIVDTNILLSALLKDFISREMILNKNLDLYIPELAIGEIENKLDLISKKTGTDIRSIRLLLDNLLNSITIVPFEDFREYYEKAQSILGHIGEGDVPFLALALSFKNEGIWTQDKDFSKQNESKVWATTNLMNYLDIK